MGSMVVAKPDLAKSEKPGFLGVHFIFIISRFQPAVGFVDSLEPGTAAFINSNAFIRFNDQGHAQT